MARTGAYRFFIGDAYSYRNSILQTIEHGPEGNALEADYCGVTYLYSENRPTVDFEIPTLAQRQVVDPVNITFTADWTVPIKLCQNELPIGPAVDPYREKPEVESRLYAEIRARLSRERRRSDTFAPGFRGVSRRCDSGR
jgi:hypothetical protein